MLFVCPRPVWTSVGTRVHQPLSLPVTHIDHVSIPTSPLLTPLSLATVVGCEILFFLFCIRDIRSWDQSECLLVARQPTEKVTVLCYFTLIGTPYTHNLCAQARNKVSSFMTCPNTRFQPIVLLQLCSAELFLSAWGSEFTMVWTSHRRSRHEVEI